MPSRTGGAGAFKRSASRLIASSSRFVSSATGSPERVEQLSKLLALRHHAGTDRLRALPPVLARPPRKQNEPHPRPRRVNVLEQCGSGGTRHFFIRDDGVDGLGIEKLKSAKTVRGRQNLPAEAGELARENLQERSVVVHDKDDASPDRFIGRAH